MRVAGSNLGFFLFLMKTENVVRALAGSLVLLALVLSRTLHPNWILLAAFVGANLLQSAFTGFCPPEILLNRLRSQPQTGSRGGCCGGRCSSEPTPRGSNPSTERHP